MNLRIVSHNARVSAGRTLMLTALSTIALASCGNDLPLELPPLRPAKGIVVLDGFIQPGLTLVADSGSSTSRIAFGPGTEFDGGGFSMQNDTVLAVSSRAAGDLLYIADLKSGTMRRLQMPTQSNPGSARLLQGANGRSLIAVALRDSSTIAMVSVTGNGAPTISRIANAGLCPTDVFQYGNATWVVDANTNCNSDYSIVGDVRLIRIPSTGTTRDTITIPGMRGSSASAIVDGPVAYISSAGVADFSTFPYTLVASGRVAKIGLSVKTVLSQVTMPAQSYGAGTKFGADGFLYVSLYENLSTFSDRIIKLNPNGLTVQSSTSSPFMALRNAANEDMTCGSGVADALGRLHCLVNGTGSATSVVVFNTTGQEIRRVRAGQGGVDMALR